MARNFEEGGASPTPTNAEAWRTSSLCGGRTRKAVPTKPATESRLYILVEEPAGMPFERTRGKPALRLTGDGLGDLGLARGRRDKCRRRYKISSPLAGNRFGGTLIGYGGAAVEEAAGGEEFGVEEGGSGGA